MSRRIKKASEDEWSAIGKRAQEIQFEIWVLMNMSAPFMPKQSQYGLVKASDGMTQFRSKAESEMWKRGGPKSLDIFYGLLREEYEKIKRIETPSAADLAELMSKEEEFEE